MNTDRINDAIKNLDRTVGRHEGRYPIPFEAYLGELVQQPERVLRNVFNIFYDMVKNYVGEGIHEYPDDSDSFKFIFYDWSPVFVEGVDQPFFADRLFSYRLMSHVEALKRGAQQNKIYVFDGPPGCGKSTFLNNLLNKFQAYANTEAGMRYETVWRLDPKALGNGEAEEGQPVIEQLSRLLRHELGGEDSLCGDAHNGDASTGSSPSPPFGPGKSGSRIEMVCPSHDNPIMLIPKSNRRNFLKDLLKDSEFSNKLFSEKEYEWVFEEIPCTICSSLYEALLDKLGSPGAVFKMVYARPYRFSRRMGEGISVYNPGDLPPRQSVWRNPLLQRRLNGLFVGERVQYLFSRYAKTNNGVYALMDIKSHNTERMIELHNIISEGVHKVEDTEENVNSLFFAVMNPEDKKNVQHIPSFSDRIEYIHIPYVLDLKTEVAIYREIFGQHIESRFMPRVLRNFARVIISSRLKKTSDALQEWIGSSEKYSLYCDKNMQLLKIEIYMGRVPPWLSEEDRKKLTPRRRRRILAEAENEGLEGFSGRDSIKIFNEFFSFFAKENKLINILDVGRFFTQIRPDLSTKIPEGFLDSLIHLYNFKILQEVKESLYYYNEEQISRDIQNYLFALNFDPGSVVTCRYTGEDLDIDEAFFEGIENRLLGAGTDAVRRKSFRKDAQREYTAKTLTQEIVVEGKPITDTRLYQVLFERYVYHLKEKVLDPFLENENFRRAIRDYDQDIFKTYDQRIQNDVHFLIKNLIDKFGYTRQGAKEICMYVIDRDLAKAFAVKG